MTIPPRRPRGMRDVPEPVYPSFNAREIMERAVKIYLDSWRARATTTDLRTMRDWSFLVMPQIYHELQFVDHDMKLINIPYDTTSPLPAETGHMALPLEIQEAVLKHEMENCTPAQKDQLKSVFQLELQKKYISEWDRPRGQRPDSREIYLDTDTSPSREFMAQTRPDYRNPLPPPLVNKLEFFLNTTLMEKVRTHPFPADSPPPS